MIIRDGTFVLTGTSKLAFAANLRLLILYFTLELNRLPQLVCLNFRRLLGASLQLPRLCGIVGVSNTEIEFGLFLAE